MSEERRIVRWIGEDRRGSAHTGTALTDCVSEFIAKHFRAGWRRFTVKADGQVLGEIRRNVDGVRTWWSE